MNKEDQREKLKGAIARLVEIAHNYRVDVELYHSDAFGDLDYPDDCEIANNAGFAEGIMFALTRLKGCLRDE